jgi:hypothetical protein
MISATRLAAGIPVTPIEVISDRTTTTACAEAGRSIPYTWATKRAATHSYKAEPDIFKEVPRGTTRLQILRETPALFSKQSIVIGRDAEEELVEKAAIRAGAIALKWLVGFTFAIHFKKIGTTTRLNTSKLLSTVKENQVREQREEKPVVAATLATKQKTPRGRHFMIIWVKEIMVWKRPEKKF